MLLKKAKEVANTIKAVTRGNIIDRISGKQNFLSRVVKTDNVEVVDETGVSEAFEKAAEVLLRNVET